MRLRVITILGAAVIVAGCGGGSNNSPTSPSSPTVNVPFSTTDLTVGTGAEATVGRTVAVDYIGWLYSATAAENKGTQFDSSLNPGRTPLVFVVGSNQVIAGFSQGVQGMRVGGTRRVVIPPSLGYGAQANGPIPGNSTLIFEIALRGVQ
jgi:FKBP-type peptidyl-prolyl cis-trans isomerase FkpA